MSGFPQKELILIERRAGTLEDPFISISEQRTLYSNRIKLTEQPYNLKKVTVTGESITWSETTSVEPTATQYYVDYLHGFVYFHVSNIGKTLTFAYFGKGYEVIGASRVWTLLDENGDVAQTLEDIIGAGVGSWSYKGEYSGSIAYVVNNVATYNSETYICIQDSTGNLPTNTTYWRKIAASGSVTSVSSANSDISIANPTTAPTLTLNSGTGANQIVKRDSNGDVVGNITGNAATVTTNANLTGDVTSSGNTTSIASGVIVNDDIHASAAIDASKIADGSVSNTEFQYISTLSSNAQTQLTDHENRITTIETELESTDPIPTTLTLGTSIYPITHYSMLENFEMDGRTLVNLLGNDGNCESLTPFSFGAGGVNPVLSTTQKMSGTNSIKATNSGTQTSYVYKDYSYPLSASKQYVFAGWMHIESRTTGGLPYIQLNDVGTFTIRYSATALATIGSWQFIYVKVPTSNTLVGTGFRLLAGLGNTGDTVVYIDDIRLYEVPQSVYDAIGTTHTTDAQIDSLIPYVDSVQSIRNPYAISEGKNLLPPFSKWTLHANAVMNGDYELTLNATGGSQNSYCEVIAVGGQQYTLQVVATASAGNIQAFIDWHDVNGTFILSTSTLTQSNTPLNVTAPSNATKGRVYFRGSVAGTFTFTEPMLNVGSTALPFEPQNRSLVAWLDTFRSNVDNTVVDKLYYDGSGNARKVKRFEEIDLDGSLTWSFVADVTGYKVVGFPFTESYGILGKAKATKYDGKILTEKLSALDAVDQFFVAGDYSVAVSGNKDFAISISDTDSNWAEAWAGTLLDKVTYTNLSRDCTASEAIKAYFNGWRWAAGGGWTGIVSGTVNNNVDSVISTLDVGFFPYKLQYQLATPIDVPVQTEGDVLSVFDGDNQITLGAGVVVREAANPVLDGGSATYNISNTVVGSSSYLQYRTKRIIEIFRNAEKDNLWSIIADVNAYGKERARIPSVNFDNESAYSVTYFVLDQYKFGISPQSITSAYEANLNEVVAKLVERNTELAYELSVVKNQYAMKQQPNWISPTLLNGWVNYGSGTHAECAFYKDEFGNVTVKGAVKSGTVSSVAFYLPKGYRPLELLGFPCISSTGGSISLARIYINPSGSVEVVDATTDWLSFGNIKFRAEQ